MNILHLFSISIVILISLYPAYALGTSQMCNTITLPHNWPSSHIYIKDTSGNMPYIPLIYHTAILHDDDVWNNSTQPRTVQVTLTIQNQDTGQQVFNQTQSLRMNACSGPESVKWRFVPLLITNYIATVSDDRGNLNMIFNSMLDANELKKFSSPLEQLRFGIDPHSVVCKQDLQLMIKSEDGSPACVKPDTTSKLTERGWGWGMENTTHSGIDLLTKTTIFDTGVYPFSINVTNTDFTVNYNISGNNKLVDANMDSQSKSLILSLNTTSNGTLVVSIPRALLDIKKNDRGMGEFYMLADGQETTFKEIHTTLTDRIFSIPFQNGTKNIEIIATELI